MKRFTALLLALLLSAALFTACKPKNAATTAPHTTARPSAAPTTLPPTTIPPTTQPTETATLPTVSELPTETAAPRA